MEVPRDYPATVKAGGDGNETWEEQNATLDMHNPPLHRTSYEFHSEIFRGIGSVTRPCVGA